MDRFSLSGQKRQISGKKVKGLRKQGWLPAHVFGKGLESENLSVSLAAFHEVFKEAGETGLIDLKMDSEVRPVLIRGVQYDPITASPIHIDFYQVNLKVNVKVPVPLILIGEEPELVKTGEAIVLQTVNELEVEALPTDLVENIEINISTLKQIDDAITIQDLKYDREKLTISADPEEIVVKLAPAVTAEMEKLLEEQAAETAEAQAESAPVEGEAVTDEGEVSTEGETTTTETPAEDAQSPQTEEKPPEK